MTTERLYELFVNRNTKEDGTTNRDFKNLYGDVSLNEGFEMYLQEVGEYVSLKKEITKFEAFLISQNIKCTTSQISESRYYFYKGTKYRFSNHIYPTGSMTNELLKVVDLAANPELIKDVEY